MFCILLYCPVIQHTSCHNIANTPNMYHHKTLLYPNLPKRDNAKTLRIFCTDQVYQHKTLLYPNIPKRNDAETSEFVAQIL